MALLLSAIEWFMGGDTDSTIIDNNAVLERIESVSHLAPL
jgi:hypothetical protein